MNHIIYLLIFVLDLKIKKDDGSISSYDPNLKLDLIEKPQQNNLNNSNKGKITEENDNQNNKINQNNINQEISTDLVPPSPPVVNNNNGNTINQI